MSRSFAAIRTGSVLSVSLVLALAVAGCAETGRPLAIAQAQKVEATTAGCAAAPDRTTSSLSEGVLDVALDQPYPYLMYPLIQNRLPELKEGGIVFNEVDVTSVEVDIVPPPGVSLPFTDICPAHFDFPLRLKLEAGGEGTGPVEIIRPCHSTLFRELFEKGRLDHRTSERVRMQAVVKVKGRHGGTSISSDEFEFTVRVCYGCLHQGYREPDFRQFNISNVPLCSKLTNNPYPGNLCNPGQDVAPILCCAKDEISKELVCPAPFKVTATGAGSP